MLNIRHILALAKIHISLITRYIYGVNTNQTQEEIIMKVNLNTRILNSLKDEQKAVYELSNEGFGTPNTIRKALTRLRREGKVGIVSRENLGLGKPENIWAAVDNNSMAA